MYRAIPVSNKLLSKKWDEQRKAIHYKKLKEMKPSIDAACPTTYGKYKLKAKKEQILEGEFYIERYTEIERENRILLEKMSTIFQTRTKEITNAKYHLVKSLNKDARKKQLVQITMENQALLKRLQEKQPSYNINRWERERANNEKMLKNICEYPYRLGVTDELKRRNSSEYKPRHISNPRKPRKLAPLESDQMIVFKKGVVIADRHFNIEITLDKENLIITAIDEITPDTFMLEISISEANVIMGGKKKYANLVNKFTLEDGELVLLEAKEVTGKSAPIETNKKRREKTQSSSHTELRDAVQDLSTDPEQPCVKSYSEEPRNFSQLSLENKQSNQEQTVSDTVRKSANISESVDFETKRATISVKESL